MLESRTITTASVGDALCTPAMGKGRGSNYCGYLSHVSSPAHSDRYINTFCKHKSVE
jgi:hypothetical protein